MSDSKVKEFMFQTRMAAIPDDVDESMKMNMILIMAKEEVETFIQFLELILDEAADDDTHIFYTVGGYMSLPRSE